MEKEPGLDRYTASTYMSILKYLKIIKILKDIQEYT